MNKAKINSRSSKMSSISMITKAANNRVKQKRLSGNLQQLHNISSPPPTPRVFQRKRKPQPIRSKLSNVNQENRYSQQKPLST